MPKVWVESGPEEVDHGHGPELVTYRTQVILCGPCLDEGREVECEERLSLGLFAGYYCDECWRKSGYRTEGRAGFDPGDAGETYDADDAAEGGGR